DKEPGLSQTEIMGLQQNASEEVCGLEINGVSKFRLGLEERGMFRPTGVLGVKGFSKQLRMELSFRSSNDKVIAVSIRDCECHLQAM
ncbi:hypothetical protein CDAR_231051, partial [Caerostris darwini]